MEIEENVNEDFEKDLVQMLENLWKDREYKPPTQTLWVGNKEFEDTMSHLENGEEMLAQYYKNRGIDFK
jgi:hypothetical protein